MYQELLQPKRGKMSDLLVIILLIALIFVVEPLAVALNTVSNIGAIIVQVCFVAFIIYFCLWFYKNRLRSFRITLITDNSDELGELEKLPEGFSEYENGSLFVESLVGLTGGYVAMIHKSEIISFSEYNKLSENKIHGAIRLNAVINKNDSELKTYELNFNQDGKKYRLLFQASEKLAKQLKTA